MSRSKVCEVAQSSLKLIFVNGAAEGGSEAALVDTIVPEQIAESLAAAQRSRDAGEVCGHSPKNCFFFVLSFAHEANLPVMSWQDDDPMRLAQMICQYLSSPLEAEITRPLRREVLWRLLHPELRMRSRKGMTKLIRKVAQDIDQIAEKTGCMFLFHCSPNLGHRASWSETLGEVKAGKKLTHYLQFNALYEGFTSI